MEFINQMEPSFDKHEREALNAYMLEGGWGTEFRKTRTFEDMLKEYTGARHCWIMPNGTLSLVAALEAVGIGVGDEVICPDYTMAATANAAELIGAKSVFVDIDRKTLCMDFAKMKDAVTDRTKAIFLVSINGRYPKEMQQFVDFCAETGIHLIEDAAQSLGSFCNGRHLGRYGEIGSFSFSAPKIITTGQGGALITDDDELSEKIKKIRDFGRLAGGSDHYLTKGWNFKFTDFQAVIGIEQMKKLPQRVERKKAMGKLYDRLLAGIPGVELIKTDYRDTSPWFFDILCERREELQVYLKEKGIGSRPFYPPLHAEPAYGYIDLSFPVTEEIAAKGLWLPSSVLVTDDEIACICNTIRDFYLINSEERI
ncbi:MAG: DegT/DnrJ/EryC1/StrS family aminotransferase [Oscillospiraceae bacterium]|nr:DegT/DnrJ/EryC1/StrS family aminotransferase [Oscillospiraceae bacterium]